MSLDVYLCHHPYYVYIYIYIYIYIYSVVLLLYLLTIIAAYQSMARIESFS